MRQFVIGKYLSNKDRCKKRLQKARTDGNYVLARMLYREWVLTI